MAFATVRRSTFTTMESLASNLRWIAAAACYYRSRRLSHPRAGCGDDLRGVSARSPTPNPLQSTVPKLRTQ